MYLLKRIEQRGSGFLVFSFGANLIDMKSYRLSVKNDYGAGFLRVNFCRVHVMREIRKQKLRIGNKFSLPRYISVVKTGTEPFTNHRSRKKRTLQPSLEIELGFIAL